MKKAVAQISVGGKKYPYNLTKNKDGSVRFVCEAANINQDFLAEDIANLLVDLPELIILEKDYKKENSVTIQFRVSPSDKKKIEKKAVQSGYPTVSAYARDLVLA